MVQERCIHCSGRKVSICNVIDTSDLAHLVVASEQVCFSAGRVFIQEGTTAHDFYVVANGRVKLFNLLPDGRRQITAFAGMGDFLGLAASRHYAFNAEVLEDAVLCRFSRMAIERLIQRFPRFEHRLREEATHELVRMQGRLLLLGRKTARERVASFLLEYCGVLRPATARQRVEMKVRLPMLRSDIADYLGLTIETVSRTISRFRKENLIMIHDISYVTLLDTARLITIADGIN